MLTATQAYRFYSADLEFLGLQPKDSFKSVNHSILIPFPLVRRRLTIQSFAFVSLTSPSQIYPYSFLTSPAPKLRSGMIKHLCIAVEFKTSTYCCPHMSILNLRLASKILSPHSAPHLLITPHCICAFE